MLVARVYIRVSTDQQDLERQEAIVEDAKAKGFYVAGVYREKASGTIVDRSELNRMIDDIQEGDVVIAEQMDRLSRLPLPEAEALIKRIKDKGARLAIPNIVDLSELISNSQGVAKVVLESIQDMLLKLALQMAHDDYNNRRVRQKQGIAVTQANDAKETDPKKRKYQGRKPNTSNHKRIIAYRSAGESIARTAELCECSTALVKKVWKKHNETK